jgi:hypothetical protein
VQIGETGREVVDRREEQVLHRPRRRLDGRRRERRLTVRRKEHAMDARGFGAAEERADVLGIFERIEHEDEWRLLPARREREDVIHRRIPPRADDERDPLVAVEPRERRERPAFDFDDRDPEARGVQDEPLKRFPPRRHDEQAMGGPSRNERLLDRAASRDQLLVGTEQTRLVGLDRRT